MAFIRLAFGTGLEEPEHIGEFLRSLVQRDYDAIVAIMTGGFKDEFRYFREEPLRIMSGR
jgi:predicted RNA-binding protein